MKVNLTKDKEEILHLAQLSHDYHRNHKTRLVWKDQTLNMGVRRLKSEFGVARALGIEPDIARGIGADPGYDGIYQGYTYEVKETEYFTGKLAYNPAKHPNFNQDIWVLVHVLDYCWTVNVRGWRWRKEMSFYWFVCDFDKRAWCIDQKDLKDIRKMLEHTTLRTERLHSYKHQYSSQSIRL